MNGNTKKRKLSPNIIGFVIASFLAIGSLWIYYSFIEKKSDHIIDNPSKYTLNIKIDNKDYIIAPNQYVDIHLSKGLHTISAKTDKDSILLNNETFKVDKGRGIINPTKNVYYIFGMPYGVKVNVDSIFDKNIHKYKGKIYHGDLKLDSTIYFEDFYYNLDENFPKITKKSENKHLRTKVFRENDFKQYYFEHFE